jgi:hypothetical protein
VVPWLDAHLRADAAAWSAFEDVLSTDTELTWEGGCTSVSAPVVASDRPGLSVSPNPGSSSFAIRWAGGEAVHAFRVHDVRGRVVRRAGESSSWDGRSTNRRGAAGRRVLGARGTRRRRVCIDAGGAVAVTGAGLPAALFLALTMEEAAIYNSADS